MNLLQAAMSRREREQEERIHRVRPAELPKDPDERDRKSRWLSKEEREALGIVSTHIPQKRNRILDLFKTNDTIDVHLVVDVLGMTKGAAEKQLSRACQLGLIERVSVGIYRRKV